MEQAIQGAIKLKKTNSTILALVVISVCLIALSQNAYSFGEASRSPATPAGGDETDSVEDGSVIDFNPLRVPVMTDAGYNSVTSILVDTTTGVVQGYAEYSLASDQTYADIDAAGGSGVGAIFSLDTFLVGPGTGGSDTVDVTVEMAFDGEFIITDGSPTLFLGADLTATTLNFATTIPTGMIYQSVLTFSSPAIADPGAPVDTIFGSSVSSVLGGGGSMEFDGASAEVISATLENLDAILRLTFPLTIGDSFSLAGVMIGGAGPSPDITDTDMTDGFDVLAAAGAVDFSNSASLSIILPAGYSFSGEDPLLSSIVSSAPVPIPAALWLFVSGLMVLVRKRRCLA